MFGSLLLLLLAGCGGDDDGSGGGGPPEPLTAGNYEREMTYGGETRTYTLVVPEQAEETGEPMPLIVLYHGAFGDSATVLNQAHMRTAARNYGYMVAAPDGTSSTECGNESDEEEEPPENCPARSWNAGVESGIDADDVGFTDALIEDVAGATPTDLNRVYAVGFSLGGAMAYRAACELSDRIAAATVIAGFMSDEDLDGNGMAYTCDPERSVPILHIHGLADECVPFEGGQGEGLSSEPREPIQTSINEWAERDGCTTNTVTTLKTLRATCKRHYNCDGETRVELCTLRGHGHAWPSGTLYPRAVRQQCGGRMTRVIDANQRLWRFMSQFTLSD